MFIAIRQGYFSREVLRGLLATRFDDSSGSEIELWVAPPMDDRAHLEACLRNRNVVGVISRGLSREMLAFIEKRDIPVVSIRGPEESEEDNESFRWRSSQDIEIAGIQVRSLRIN
mgnify:CR=1 FL=1